MHSSYLYNAGCNTLLPPPPTVTVQQQGMCYKLAMHFAYLYNMQLQPSLPPVTAYVWVVIQQRSADRAVHQADAAAPDQMQAAWRRVIDVATQCGLFKLLLQQLDAAGLAFALVVIKEVEHEAAQSAECVLGVGVTATEQQKQHSGLCDRGALKVFLVWESLRMTEQQQQEQNCEGCVSVKQS
jgi:hypothetical protein